MTEEQRDIVIVGGGPAGLTAGIYAVRGGARTLIFTGTAAGGQLLLTTGIENFPGFPKAVPGPELMQRMIDQAKNLGCVLSSETVGEINLDERPFKIKTSSGKIYSSGTLIIATGAEARWLDIPSVEKFRNKGVSACATCDGFFYRGKEVCVIGGGDTAAEDASFLSKFASKVYIVHRRDKFRAGAVAVERIKKNPKIEIIYDHVLYEILGGEKIEAARLKNVKDGKTREIKVSGVFMAIGHDPEVSLVKDKVELTEGGYIKTDRTKTSVEGVFAAGDVMDPVYKQAVTAAGTGTMAAMEALKYLESQGPRP